jgi:hypothetical protein
VSIQSGRRILWLCALLCTGWYSGPTLADEVALRESIKVQARQLVEASELTAHLMSQRATTLDWTQGRATPTWFATVLISALAAALLLRLVRARQTMPTQPLGVPLGHAPDSPVYRARPAYIVGMIFLSLLMVCSGLAGAWTFGAVIDIRDTPIATALTAAASLLAGFGVLVALDTMAFRLIVNAETLEIHDLFRVRCVRRGDIASRQLLPQSRGSSSTLLLRLNEPAGRILRLPVVWKSDERLDAWFQSIPDADAEAAKAFEDQVKSDTALGDSPDARLERLAAARRLARYAAYVPTAALCWSVVYPKPYELLVMTLAALPWVGLALTARSPSLYELGVGITRSRPNLTSSLTLPSFGLALLAYRGVHVLDWPHSLIFPIVGVIGFSMATFLVMPHLGLQQMRAAWILPLIFALYGYGLGVIIDAHWDRSEPTVYPTRVLGKHISSGRSKTPFLRLAPWGARAEAQDTSVSWDLYNQTVVGDSVCVALRQGLLGVPWYRVDPCERALNTSGASAIRGSTIVIASSNPSP